MAHISIH